MSSLFCRDRRTRPYPYVPNVVFWEERRRLDWRLEFALLLVKTLTVVAVLVVAALVAFLPDASLRALLCVRQATPPLASLERR